MRFRRKKHLEYNDESQDRHSRDGEYRERVECELIHCASFLLRDVVELHEAQVHDPNHEDQEVHDEKKQEIRLDEVPYTHRIVGPSDRRISDAKVRHEGDAVEQRKRWKLICDDRRNFEFLKDNMRRPNHGKEQNRPNARD